MSLPAPVLSRTHDYLRAIDAVAPGFVQGMYVLGSAALGDWAPRSDVDALVLSTARPGPDLLPALAELHSERTRPYLDLAYLHWDDLGLRPENAPAAPFALGGRFFDSGRGPRVPVTWHTLAEAGVALRGPEPAELRIHADPADLEAWAERQLRHYWAPRVARSARLASQFGLHALSAWEVEWTGLGVARAHYTLRHRRVVSKSAAGRYAAAHLAADWPAERSDPTERIVAEALRIRSGTGRRRYREPFTRRRDLLRFAGRLLDDAAPPDGDRYAVLP